MKKSLSILLALGMLFLSAPGCSGEKNLPENMERITDEEMIAALNGYKAGMYGWQRYYTGMLTDLTSAPSHDGEEDADHDRQHHQHDHYRGQSGSAAAAARSGNIGAAVVASPSRRSAAAGRS